MADYRAKSKGVFQPPDKSGALTKAGEWRYDATTGATLWRDGVVGEDKTMAGHGAWIALPYNTTNFQNTGADQVAQYRIVGNNVQMRGVAQTKTGITYTYGTTIIGTLPAGARPPSSTALVQVPVYVYDGGAGGIGGTMAQLQIDNNGVMMLLRDLTGRANTRTSPYYVHLWIPPFSVIA